MGRNYLGGNTELHGENVNFLVNSCKARVQKVQCIAMVPLVHYSAISAFATSIKAACVMSNVVGGSLSASSPLRAF